MLVRNEFNIYQYKLFTRAKTINNYKSNQIKLKSSTEIETDKNSKLLVANNHQVCYTCLLFKANDVYDFDKYTSIALNIKQILKSTSLVTQTRMPT